MKKKQLFILLLLICLGGFLLLRGEKASVRFEYSLSLPEGYVLQTDEKTGNAEILRDGQTIGKVVNCLYTQRILGSTKPSDIHSLSFHIPLYSEIILATLEAADVPGTDLASFDRMMEGSLYTDCQIWLGNREQEYQYYLYLFEEGILALWFDLSQTELSRTYEIAAGFSVTR